MELQKNPNAWSCLPTAFAMCLDIPVGQVIQDIGHDGSEIIFKNVPEPNCRRGFHTSELIHYCYVYHKLTISIIPVHPRLWSEDKKQMFDVYKDDDRIHQYLSEPKAVIIEPTHAVAWDGKMAFDPRGYYRDLKSLRIQHIVLF